MRSGAIELLIKLAWGLVVVALSFGATTIVMHFWWTPRANETNLIHVTQATYGESCSSYVSAAGQANVVRTGNATVAASQTCDNSDVFCPVYVDAVRIGDPAPGCDKDFTVNWQCGAAQTIHTVHVLAEAFKKIAWIGCPAQ
jgi:hypothetical protein